MIFIYILLSLNLYLTYRLAEFSGAITTKRNRISDSDLVKMRENHIKKSNKNRG